MQSRSAKTTVLRSCVARPCGDGKITGVRRGIVEGDDFSVFPPIVVRLMRKLRRLVAPEEREQTTEETEDDED